MGEISEKNSFLWRWDDRRSESSHFFSESRLRAWAKQVMCTWVKNTFKHLAAFIMYETPSARNIKMLPGLKLYPSNFNLSFLLLTNSRIFLIVS